MYPSNQRTLGTVTLFMIQLFLVCYLFNEINKEVCNIPTVVGII